MKQIVQHVIKRTRPQMQLFERDIETILHDLKSVDFDIRKQAIADLAISNCNE